MKTKIYTPGEMRLLPRVCLKSFEQLLGAEIEPDDQMRFALYLAGVEAPIRMARALLDGDGNLRVEWE